MQTFSIVMSYFLTLVNSNLCITDAAFIELMREKEQLREELKLKGENYTYHALNDSVTPL